MSNITSNTSSNICLNLIPVGLDPNNLANGICAEVRSIVAQLPVFIAENSKTARAFLKLTGTNQPIQQITIHQLSAKTNVKEIRQWLHDAQKNQQSVGLLSEAGCPAVADPGANVVQLAHQMGIKVQPWIGPSSILLGLMGSGLNGQSFAFHGYAPIKPPERNKQLRAWEQISRQQKQTQILIETPYRNQAMFDTLISQLHEQTSLCLALALTTEHEWIKTATIKEWRTIKLPDLNKKPCLFLYLA